MDNGTREGKFRSMIMLLKLYRLTIVKAAEKNFIYHGTDPIIEDIHNENFKN